MPNEIKVSPKRDSFKLALAQLNPVVGDIDGNLKKARVARAEAAAKGADLIAFTELYLTGYPIEDLVLKPAFQQAAREACEAFAHDTSDGGPAVLIGLPWAEGPFVHNAVAYLDQGRIEAVRLKYNLPNYGVFDEKRVFAPGPLPEPIEVRGVSLGVPVCEDIWSEEVCRALAKAGAGLLIVPNGSPYWMDKQGQRYSIARARIAETGLPLAYVNQVGGQDELVFDGASFVLNADGSLAVQMPAWEEALGVTEWRKDGKRWRCLPQPLAEIEQGDAANYLACVTGLRDYVEKNGFPGVVLGLSGGINSALCVAMAVDALGASRVHGVMLPYLYTSNESLNDAAQTAEALGIRYDVMPISPAVEGLTKSSRVDLRRRRLRHGRGELAVARPRHAAHGALQQIRSDGDHHRQQVGSVGRLCHALWRHEWRVQPDQGFVQDASLCACPLSQSRAAEGLPRAHRPRHPGECPDQGADGGAEA